MRFRLRIGTLECMPWHEAPDPRSFFYEGGQVGILMLHGLIGAPAEMRPLGEHLAAHGYTVCGPRLAGHGTRAAELANLRWTDWYASAQLGLDELLVSCSDVVVIGLSMGALLSVRLAVERPEISGVVLMAPALEVTLPVLRWAEPISRLLPEVPRFPAIFHGLADPSRSKHIWSYPVFPTPALSEFYRLQQQTGAWLPQVHQPLLLLHGQLDPTVPPKASRTVFQTVCSTDKEIHLLERSGHTLTVDQEYDRMAALVTAWLKNRFHA